MEDSSRQSSLPGCSSKNKKKWRGRRNGCESIEDTIARWKKHNKLQINKVPGKGSKKGCMKGKAIEAARAYDYAARAMYGPNAILNFPDNSHESGDQQDSLSSSAKATETASTGSKTTLVNYEDFKVGKLKVGYSGSRVVNRQSGSSGISAVNKSAEEAEKFQAAECSGRGVKDGEWNLADDWMSSRHVEAEAPVLRREMDGELAEIVESCCHGINDRNDFLQNETASVECLYSDMETDRKPFYDAQMPLTTKATGRWIPSPFSHGVSDIPALKGEGNYEYVHSDVHAAGQLQSGRPPELASQVQPPGTNPSGSLSYIQEADLGVGCNFDLSNQDINWGLVGEQELLGPWFPELQF
ncbi:DEHYDRATION-RESPONSIVE ELEMENT-BINDING PROTEIN 2C [Salix purpurea]|uniref:DEHYDRATION-RESPONSIVE ELEMENT-BINDING PROTEIN 2C n=1 Tax=Salix purpurea TaxID=77065 RepID=A0A9Q1A2D2_SALPP|nr:DEHYDRATION-RESPONSIVE ELEMENT-BINDING PROTEIN 2C [Salix purpurea]